MSIGLGLSVGIGVGGGYAAIPGAAEIKALGPSRLLLAPKGRAVAEDATNPLSGSQVLQWRDLAGNYSATATAPLQAPDLITNGSGAAGLEFLGAHPTHKMLTMPQIPTLVNATAWTRTMVFELTDTSKTGILTTAESGVTFFCYHEPGGVFFFPAGGSSYRVEPVTTALKSRTWVWDSTFTGKDRCKPYVNGVFVDQASSGAFGSLPASAAFERIGCNASTGESVQPAYVRLYALIDFPRALSAGECANLHTYLQKNIAGL